MAEPESDQMLSSIDGDKIHVADSASALQADRTIFSGLESLARRREIILQSLGNGPNALDVAIDEYLSPVTAIIDGREFVMFGSNAYLGLAFDERCRQAAIAASARFGYGTTASRLASGTTSLHLEFEADLSQYLKKDHCVIFSTGFQANLGVIGGMTGNDDAILIDEACHSSIFVACELSRARKVKFKHNDMANLEQKLQRIAAPMDQVLVITESIFSAIGDEGLMREIVGLKHKYGFYLMVDDAHSFGMYGDDGASLVHVQGIEDDVDIHMITFSKSLGVIGGAVLSNHPAFPCLKYAARAFMFSAALPSSIIAGAKVALDILQHDKALRQRLWDNIDQIRRLFLKLGLTLNKNASPVVSAVLPDFKVGYRMWKHLYDNGYYANALLPPATPPGTHIIRFSVSACHSKAQIEGLVEVLADYVSGVPKSEIAV